MFESQLQILAASTCVNPQDEIGFRRHPWECSASRLTSPAHQPGSLRKFGGAAGITWSAPNPCGGTNGANGGLKNAAPHWEAAPALWTMRSGGCRSCPPAEVPTRKHLTQNHGNP